MALAWTLFVAFALVSALGAFLLGAYFRSWRYGVVVATIVLAFFAALGWLIGSLAAGAGLR